MTWTRTSAGRAIMGLVALYAVMIAIVIVVRTTGYKFSPPVRLGIALAVAVPAVLLVSKYWNAIDELAREAQKWACFWGGTIGMGVGLLAVTFKPLNLVALFPPDTTPAHYLAYGGMAVMLFQIAGFTVAWIYWWVARR
jgi:hypothetical protein